MSTSVPYAPVSTPARSRRFGPFRIAVVLLVLFAASLFEPRVFRFVVGGIIRFEAWRRGATVDFDRIGGSFFEPVTLAGSRWSFQGEAGAMTRIEIARVEAKLVWKNLLPRTTARWFQRLSITGVQGKVMLAVADSPKESRKRGWKFWRPSAGRWAVRVMR